jgi:hypothetical protein
VKRAYICAPMHIIREPRHHLASGSHLNGFVLAHAVSDIMARPSSRFLLAALLALLMLAMMYTAEAGEC